jgi:hypothetical protein
MLRTIYWVTFRPGSGIDEVKLNFEDGKKLGEIWVKDKNGIFEIDGNFYDGSQIISIIKTTEKML